MATVSVDSDPVDEFLQDTVGWTVERRDPQPGTGSQLSPSCVDDYNCTVCQTSCPQVVADTGKSAVRRQPLQCQVCNKFLHQDCIDQQFGLPSNINKPGMRWVCPNCSQAALWNDTMCVKLIIAKGPYCMYRKLFIRLNQWLLLPTRADSQSREAQQRYYPCEIVSTD